MIECVERLRSILDIMGKPHKEKSDKSESMDICQKECQENDLDKLKTDAIKSEDSRENVIHKKETEEADKDKAKIDAIKSEENRKKG